MENKDKDDIYSIIDDHCDLLGAVRSPEPPKKQSKNPIASLSAFYQKMPGMPRPPKKPLEPVTEKNNISYLAFNLPEPSDWECELFGSKLSIIPNKGEVPNWFNRLMQRICFGFKWKKIKENE